MHGNPIAVVGMAGRFAGAQNLDRLWNLLSAGRDAVTEIPVTRFDVACSYHPTPRKPGKTISRWGGLLDRVDEFDAEFFGISPREAARMDPQQRLLLEVSYEALEDAGITLGELAGSQTGTFIGQHGGDYWTLQNKAREQLSLYSMIGAAARAVLSGRLSYVYDLRGPSMSLDTACSSSLVAVHQACQSLRSGESSLAIAGGVNLVLLPEESIAYSSAGMLSAQGRCKFGDAGADGFVRSDGVGVLVLKPLDRALADGDRVRAVILSSAVNNDGQCSGFMVTPGVDGQQRMLRAAYLAAEMDPASVDFVEAHGTGTAVGDPVELEALATVLGEGRPTDRPLLVGSVKTNLGHTEAAAGIAGLIKAVLSLEHGVVPASLHLSTPNPAVPWADWPLRIPVRATDLPGDRPHLAGVSSFGFSGTNAHVVLRTGTPERQAPAGADQAGLLMLSAVTPAALRALACCYRDYLTDQTHSFRDVCFSASVRRTHHDRRLAVVAGSHSAAVEGLSAYLANEPAAGVSQGESLGTPRPRVAFVFPGQGSQWLGMGRELLATNPVFHTAMADCDEVIRAETGWSVLDLLRAGTADRLGRLDVVQPTLWAMQVALAATWQSWGVRPNVVIGHSMGEVAAVAVSGALSLADAGAVICHRSRLAKRLVGRGMMAWVELSAEQATESLAGHEHLVSVAANNGPNATLLSGDTAALNRILAGLDKRGVFTRLVKVDFASHSPQMDQVREDLVASLRGLRPRAGSLPIHSTVYDELIDGSGCDARYWASNLREPVRFAQVVTAELKAGDTVFVEISPHAMMLGSIGEIAEHQGKPALAVGSLRRDEPELVSMLGSLGRLHVAGVDVDFRAVHDGGRFVPLPPYPWQRESYWLPEQPQPATHPLLPVRTGEQVWEGRLDRAANGYLADHQVQGTPILPGMAYLELLLAAGRELHGEVALSVAKVHYHAALFLLEDWAPILRVTVDSTGQCQVHSRQSDAEPWTLHVTAVLRTGPATKSVPEPTASIRQRCAELLTGAEFYATHAARGNQWEGTFQGIEELWRTDGEVLARLRCPSPLRAGLDKHRFQPALLDACAHTLVAALPAEESVPDPVFVLGGIDEVRYHRPPGAELLSHARLLPSSRPDSFCGDVQIVDAAGALVAEILGLRLQYLLGERTAAPSPGGKTEQLAPLAQPDDVEDMLYELRWQPIGTAPAPGRAGELGSWLVLTDSGRVGRAVTAGLREAGQTVYAATLAAAFERTTTDRFRVDPGSPQHVAQLLREIAELGPCKGIVHLWALGANDAESPTARQLRRYEALTATSVLNLVRALDQVGLTGGPRLWLASERAQSSGTHDPVTAPFQAPLWGLGRAIAQEQPELRVSCVDIGSDDDSTRALVVELLADDRENQVLLRGRGRYAARLSRRVTGNSTLVPGDDEVLIRVWSAGLAGEYAGTVEAVGREVADLSVGDEVVALGTSAPAGFVVTKRCLVAAKHERLSHAQAATLPVAFLTAHYALEDRAQLRTGERVLIHDGASPVGLAAIQLAQLRGARIYATAGDAQQRAVLDQVGVKQVAGLRAAEFTEAFQGDGFGVVLNTLTGAAVSANLSLLAPHGRYIDLNSAGNSQPLTLGAARITYCPVDAEHLVAHDPERAGAVLRTVVDLVHRGVLEALPYQELSAPQAHDEHLGKAVLRFEATGSMTTPVAIRADATYLVTGGLGGIGLCLADWLVAKGAGHLVLLGRRASPAPDQSAELRRLRGTGAQVEYLAVDIADADGVGKLVAARTAEGKPPIAGVLHAAGVIEYQAVKDTDPAQMTELLRPKVLGGWVLHQVLSGQPLDFFVLFSSASSLLSSPLLGGYAAGNAFLDALASYRRGRGATATVVNWGFWASVGMVARAEAEQGRSLLPRGCASFQPEEGLAVLDRLLGENADQVAVMRTDWPSWRAAYPQAAESPLLDDLDRNGQSVPQPRLSLVHTSPPEPVELPKAAQPVYNEAGGTSAEGTDAVDIDVEEILVAQVASLLGMRADRVNRRRPLQKIGIDSLMAVDFRNRVAHELGVQLPIVKLLSGGSLTSLAEVVRGELAADN